jgi:hypothetical protein
LNHENPGNLKKETVSVRLSSLFIWAIQLALIVHVLKTGRSRWWIFVLIFMPLIGGLTYLIIEVLPEFSNSISGQRALRNVKSALDPGGEVRRQQAAWEQSPNTDNARRYAEALLEAGDSDKAESIVDRALTGMFATEPTLLLVRARLQFEQGRMNEALESLETLREHNPDFRSAEGHLLYARALEAAGQTGQALAEYANVAGYFPGVEARYRRGLCLKAAGRPDEAAAEFEAIVKDARLAPAHFRKSQKAWLDATRRELAAG